MDARCDVRSRSCWRNPCSSSDLAKRNASSSPLAPKTSSSQVRQVREGLRIQQPAGAPRPSPSPGSCDTTGQHASTPGNGQMSVLVDGAHADDRTDENRAASRSFIDGSTRTVPLPANRSHSGPARRPAPLGRPARRPAPLSTAGVSAGLHRHGGRSQPAGAADPARQADGSRCAFPADRSRILRENSASRSSGI